MARIIDFTPASPPILQPQTPGPRSYSIDIAAFPHDFIEFTAHGVKTDAKSLFRIAAELEKIASIIRSDVLSMHLV